MYEKEFSSACVRLAYVCTRKKFFCSDVRMVVNIKMKILQVKIWTKLLTVEIKRGPTMDTCYRSYPMMPTAIFRNQANYRYFSKIFGEKDDLYLTLNEIDDYFLQPKQKADRKGIENKSTLDPRNKKEVAKVCYDYSTHTLRHTPDIFDSKSPSIMNCNTHAFGVRIVKALQDCISLNSEDFYKWDSLRLIRTKEESQFQKFVFDYQEKNKEQLYLQTKKLTQLYKQWYDEKIKMLKTRIPARTYNAHIGLPHTKVCKAFLTDQIAEISEPIVISSHRGFIKRVNEEKTLSYEVLARNIVKYAQDYNNSLEEENRVDLSLQDDFLTNLKKRGTPLHTFYIPLETIMFLLIAGDYADLPAEVLFEIKKIEPDVANSPKLIIMEEPLPSRVCGWHTHKKVVEQAVLALLSIEEKQQNVPLERESIAENVKEDLKKGGTLANSLEYKLVDIETYMRSCEFIKTNTCKFSKTLIKWTLKTVESVTSPEIYTSMDVINGIDEQHRDFLYMTTIKMEYKTRFGCEILTKYEMLREWFRLKFIKHPKIICCRLDVNTYQTMAKETLTVERLERSLFTTYNLNTAQILNNLNEFLKLLLTMPHSFYMLRYNPKFKDKLILCRPSEQATQNTVYLHKLLQTNPSDLAFISQENYLPIANDVCSSMHLKHKVIPCAFRPLSTFGKSRQKAFKMLAKPLNDRDLILKKASGKTEIKLRGSATRKSKTRKRRREACLNVAEQEKERTDLQKEIESDRMFFVN
uniref:Little elongation complex subunit 2 C-terminal domain-containing protein n=1 Tax=Glossina pallidipes TaxID=7398 RepID=A0A1A9ZYX8_GLOPL